MNKRYQHLFMNSNQMGVVRHPAQHIHKHERVLFVCAAGILRSATAAHIFSAEPYNWNTRTAGASVQFALTPITEALIMWADQIYCMEEENKEDLLNIFGNHLENVLEARGPDFIKVLNIPDNFYYRDPELIKILKERVDAEISKED